MANILIVDDSSFARGTLNSVVRKGGHDVVGMAGGGKEAVELYFKLKPDLVLMDILMGDIDGISTLKTIMQKDPEAKVIMVSAVGTEEKREAARKLGALGYITKPFREEDITRAIETVLSKAEG